MDGSPRPVVRISRLGEVAAALPALLGFWPHESVVLIALGGPGGGRVGLTVRVDLPAGAASAAVARALAARVATDDPAAVLLAVVSEAPDDRGLLLGSPPGDAVAGLPHRAVVHDVVVALDGDGLPVRDAILVRGGRWWSYDCPHPCCAPGAGTPLPGGVSAVTAAAVAAGSVVEPGRAALRARIARVAGPGAAAATWSARRRRARTARDGPAAWRAWEDIGHALRRCRPGGGEALGDGEVAAVVWALEDVGVRDRALGLALGADAAAAEVLWTECTRRAPLPLDAAPATLLAVSAWLRGDGAMANIALERALESRPGYPLARLLVQALDACLPPAALRGLITEAAEAAGEAGGAQAAG
ncbi:MULTISPECIES: DUF4192 domain-containing protein [unclassified Blastococcus]